MSKRQNFESPVRWIRVGDILDLQGDPFADPRRDNPLFEFEGVRVAGIERETRQCVRIDFEGADSVGFPPAHTLRVMSREKDSE